MKAKSPTNKTAHLAANADQKNMARNAAYELIMHIDITYPEIWSGVPKTARVAIRNAIYKRIASLLLSQSRGENKKIWSKEELSTLNSAYQQGWVDQFPGWAAMARMVNDVHGNERTATDCEKQYSLYCDALRVR